VLATRKVRRAAPSERLVTRDEVVAARQAMEDHVTVDPRVHTCLVDAARNLRAHKKVLQGLSTRSLVLMIPALQAVALLNGRDYVSSQDIEYLAPFVFSHRLVVAPGAGDTKTVVLECLKGPLEVLTRSTMAAVAPMIQPQQVPPALPSQPQQGNGQAW
jgi:MoxR-like ATPase